MLESTSSDISWTSNTRIVYVNHKAVANDDINLSTHAKAKAGFLGAWIENGCSVLTMDGTSDAHGEATSYRGKLEALDLPLNKGGFPVFDMMLIGVGDDGHVGSLYPGREEVLNERDWVLPVSMKSPGSITLSLPLMTAAKKVIVAAGGTSEKYPLGKSAGMKRAIEGAETLSSFPAAGLRGKATWIIDEAAGSELSDMYK
jgi:6-phosphogluconolactonase